jgi:integrase
MPATRRPKPLYQRGGFKLYSREGRNHEIVWYDVSIGRERSASAGSTDLEEAKAALDTRYLNLTRGQDICPTCHRPYASDGRLVADAIELYLHEGEDKSSYDAIVHRLTHVTNYIGSLPSPEVRCSDIDEKWVAEFRKWAIKQPLVSTKGRVLEKKRSPSTVENSVLQLAAAIRHVKEIPGFKPKAMKDVNQSPRYRADIKTLAAMFRYAMEPKKKRENLLAFLRMSVATLGRPDAVLDISTAPERGQWMANAHVLDLNPKGREQTRKYRATIPIVRQALWMLDTAKGFIIPAASIKSAWNAMGRELRLPTAGEAGSKLVRRSVAKLLRDRLPPEAWSEVEMFLGHARFDSTSDIYAPFDPNYLKRAKQALEEVIDEVEKLSPGAFYRDFTAQGGNVASIARAKNG